MSNITYVHQDTTYDVTQLAPEGQKAFQLLVTAEQDVRSLEDRVVIAQAAAVALHAKVQEFLNEEAVLIEEVNETDED
tara:strand:- start:209 stop:442 length:234 start_codon:yes stop_codon:yes gene_type:complete